MKKNTIAICIVLILLPRAASGSPEDVVSWKWCLSQARENNPVLASSFERVVQSRIDKELSISPVLPDVGSSMSFARGKRSASETASSHSYGISARQLVFDGFQTASDLMASSERVSAELYDHALISSNVRLFLRLAFINILRVQELVNISEEIAARRRQNYELIKLRYEGGREHRGALLIAEADLAQAEFDLEQAERSVLVSNRELLEQLGVSKELPFRVSGEFELRGDYSLKPDLEELADTTPLLGEVMARKAAAAYDLRSAEADFLPKVFLTGSIGRSSGSWPPRDDEWATGLSVSFPIFERGRRFAEVARSTSRLSELKYQSLAARDSVLVTLERTWKELQDAITRLAVQQKYLMATQERARITTAQYSAGLVSFNDWIIIEDNLARAKRTYLNARADMLAAEAYWFQAAGGTIDDDQ